MKKIEAIIKPFKLDEVTDALGAAGLAGLTVVEARHLGREDEQEGLYLGARGSADFLPKLKIELVVEDSVLERAIQAIQRSARTGRVGDGRIYAYAVDEVIRIRTGERGRAAI